MENSISTFCSILLVMICNFNGIYSGDEEFIFLGCMYKDDELLLNTTIPTWGVDIPPAHIAKEEDLSSMIESFKQVYKKEIAENLPYENINDYIVYASAYSQYKKNHPDSTFQQYHNNYVANFFRRDNEFNHKIIFLNSFLTQNKELELAASFSFASGVISPPPKLIEFVKTLGNDDLPVLYFTYVPLVFEFTLGPEKTKGYILFDHGFGLAEPIVVMSDGEHSLDSGYQQHGNKMLDFTILKENENYIVSKRKPDSSNKEDPTVDFIVYVGRAYCSHQGTSYKYGLLNPVKSFLEVSMEGKVENGLYFDLEKNNDITIILNGKESVLPKEQCAAKTELLEKVNANIFGDIKKFAKYIPARVEIVERLFSENDFIAGFREANFPLIKDEYISRIGSPPDNYFRETISAQVKSILGKE